MTFAFAKFDWTEAAVAEMTRLFHEGLSASQIAAALKIGSRNAVIGKLSRVGLTRGRSRGSLASTMANVVRHATNRANEGRGMEAPHVAPRIEIAQPLASNPITIFALHNGLCRWPLWSLDTYDVDERFYCGAICDPATAYCDHHGRYGITERAGVKQRRVAA